MKTEKEKMLNGELDHPDDPELLKDRMNARKITRLYNGSSETDAVKKQKGPLFCRPFCF